ncbi:hypothetical protein EK21DRAFT_117843 [Setomelanomma holmii]|uniref:Uncharacterized protein n=1 Tax=Setomelanomma holmii TaxID=210430 RepID=A0A9P4LGG9_9PLEO|nr:hypothetical protein EK21DRAFT_117843 [Setomelanomma holmii]
MLNRIKNKLGKQDAGELVHLSDEDPHTIVKAISTEQKQMEDTSEELQDFDALTLSPAQNMTTPSAANEAINKHDYAFPTSSTGLTAINLENDNTSTQIADKQLILPNDIDTRHPYRLGWPLLPAQPVHTSHDQVPKILSPKSLHINAIRQILASHKILISRECELEVVHRHNPGKQIGKDTLTLLVPTTLVDTSNNQNEDVKKAMGKVNNDTNDTKEQRKADTKHENKNSLHTALATIQSYLQDQKLTLNIEFVHPNTICGLYTLPVLASDPLHPFLAKRKHSIKKILNTCSAEWTSLDFYYRGHGPTRRDCRPTVLIGVKEPDAVVWWGDEGIVEKIKGKVGRKVDGQVWVEVMKVRVA